MKRIDKMLISHWVFAITVVVDIDDVCYAMRFKLKGEKKTTSIM